MTTHTITHTTTPLHTPPNSTPPVCHDCQELPPTLEALAADEETADAQGAADTSCGVLEEGQADEAFLGESSVGAGQQTESKTSSVDL